MVEAEGYGIAARLFGKLVHEAFDSEDIAVRAERAQRRRAQGPLRQKVMRDCAFAEAIEGNGVTRAATLGKRHIVVRRWRMRQGEVSGGEKIDTFAKARAGDMRRAPYVVVPFGDA